MKISSSIISVLLIVLLISCNNKKQTITIVPDAQKNHLQLERIFGQVKSITIYKYLAQDVNGEQVVDSNLYACICKKYSSDGCLNKVIVMNHKKDTMSVRNITYNAQAKIIKDELFDSTGVCAEYTVYQNDTRGYRVKEERFVQDTLVQTLIYKNDGFGNVLEIVDQRPLFTVKKKFENNEVGLPVRINEFDPDGNLFKYVTIEYDNYGDPVNRRVFREDGKLMEYTYTQYDANGNLLKEVYENMITNVQDIGLYQKHDTQKNWTKEVRKIAGRAQFIIERTIEYY